MKQTINVNGVEIEVAKSNKPDTNKIHMAHYLEGALRITREMIVDDALSMQQIVNHINYLIQIACLAQSHSWQQVLNYDTVYRREQFSHGFQWGTTSAFLLNTQLTPTTTNAGPKQRNEKNPWNDRPRENVKNPGSGKIICYDWNGRSGCQRTDCRFEHVCTTCYTSSHTQMQHGKN